MLEWVGRFFFLFLLFTLRCCNDRRFCSRYFNKAKIAAFGSALLAPRRIINESGGNVHAMTNVSREVVPPSLSFSLSLRNFIHLRFLEIKLARLDPPPLFFLLYFSVNIKCTILGGHSSYIGCNNIDRGKRKKERKRKKRKASIVCFIHGWSFVTGPPWPRQLTMTSDTLRPTFQNVMQCPAIAADRRAPSPAPYLSDPAQLEAPLFHSFAQRS